MDPITLVLAFADVFLVGFVVGAFLVMVAMHEAFDGSERRDRG